MAEQQEASSVEEQQEPPVLPITTSGTVVEPGVSIRVDEGWQVSSMPEVKQYFSQDVSLHKHEASSSYLSLPSGNPFRGSYHSYQGKVGPKRQ